MSNLWDALRERMDNTKRGSKQKEKGRDLLHTANVYSRWEECRAYCDAEGSGLEFILESNECLCRGQRHELLRRGDTFLRVRQTVQRSVEELSAFENCDDNPTCLENSRARSTTTVDTTDSIVDAESTTDVDAPASQTALVTPSASNSSQPTTAVDGGGVTASTTFTAGASASTDGSATTDGAGGAESTSEASSNGGLSQGAKIGLGVGLGVGAALLIAAIVLFCLARRRKRNGMGMGSKYAPAHSDLSMVEAPYSAAAGVNHVRETPKEYSEPPHYDPPHYDQLQHHHEFVEDHREAVEEVDDRASEHFEPPHTLFQMPIGQSPITSLEPQAHNRSFTNAPLALAIPTAVGGAASPHSRDLSPAGGGGGDSPVSPISPVSGVSPINSRPSSPPRHHG